MFTWSKIGLRSGWSHGHNFLPACRDTKKSVTRRYIGQWVSKNISQVAIAARRRGRVALWR